MNAHAPGLPIQYDDAAQREAAATLGMWVFIATEVLFFGALFLAYAATRLHYGGGFAAASRHTDALLGTLETGVLLSSSLSAAHAVDALGRNARRLAAALLFVTAALGLAFLAIHAVEYWHEWREHLVPGLNFDHGRYPQRGFALFFWLYYALTGFHSLHVLVGVCVLTAFAIAALRGRFTRAYHTPVELGALYWHMVDIVWIFLYPLIYLVRRS